MRNGPLIQYYCSSCGKVLSESSTRMFKKDQLKEECPSCGSLLSNTLQNARLSPQLIQSQQITSDPTHKPLEQLSVDFQTAYRHIQDLSIRYSFDIRKIDSLLDLEACGTLCIIGEQKYAQLLIDRLCVHSLLPVRHGGIGQDQSKIIAVDAGNRTNVYRFVDFARQYGIEVEKALQKYRCKQGIYNLSVS